MDTLKQLDMVVVVFATDHLDVETLHIYDNDQTDEVATAFTQRYIEVTHGKDALKGFEVLSIVR